MIYTEMTMKAMKIAYEAHHGQLDKGGVPYIFHPFHLAEQMEDEDTVILALLHDVLEDTEVTEDELRAAGFSERILEALILLTHDPKAPYMDYIKNLKGNPLAKTVKLADLRHNSDPTRLPVMDERARRRNERYQWAIRFLEEA